MKVSRKQAEAFWRRIRLARAILASPPETVVEMRWELENEISTGGLGGVPYRHQLPTGEPAILDANKAVEAWIRVARDGWERIGNSGPPPEPAAVELTERERAALERMRAWFMNDRKP